jgi:hypothetical protein
MKGNMVSESDVSSPGTKGYNYNDQETMIFSLLIRVSFETY